MSSWTTFIRDAWQTLLLWQHMMWAWVKAHFHVRMKKKTVPEWTITAALAFCEDSGSFEDISHWFDPFTWEADFDRLIGWDNVRVDVRYIHTSAFGRVSKYRMVVRRGDSCLFPPLVTSQGPRGVLAARLTPWAHHEGASTVDVTARLIKYAGPSRDFHRGQGLKVRPLDCFPCDDHEALAARFETLTIVDAAAFQEHVFPLADNPSISLGTSVDQ